MEIVYLILLLLAVIFTGMAAFNVAGTARVNLAWLGVACFFAVPLLQAILGL